MANQPEQDQWDAGVYQIEKTDPVLGGLGGIANAPLLNLANRTKYLYSRIQEILGVGKGYAIAGGTANAITCSYTPAVSVIADGQTFKGKVAAANTGATTFTPNPAAQGGIAPLPIYGLDLQPLSGGEIVGQFAVQYNASLNSGGGAFVLVENPGGIARAIALAVADNSAAIAPTSWIRSIFAPLASPAFTGSPQAPVPPQFDNTTKLATTSFVQRALGNMQMGVRIQSAANATFAASQAGGSYSLEVASTTYTLPPLSSVLPGAAFEYLATVNAATVATAGADKMMTGSLVSSSTCVLNNGDTAKFVSNGTYWVLAGGSAALRLSLGDFGSSLATNGYQKLPSGLIIQWGTTTVSSWITTTSSGTNLASYQGALSVIFPIAFPNACLNPYAFPQSCAQYGAWGASTAFPGTYSKTSMSGPVLATCNPISMILNWIAIGY
ncbi:hypothetical protein WT81_04845 [Burkholderia stagnalis]|uniref:gp53-like domain-containing protein n=1 Tax=Burkholderia stagnalis TaxID=1503054 RepID=UPI00075FB236|nr:hypothetical protein [Burkholderia stagnalis]KWK48074.1 hypothetical protein WT80_18845 [Burkholderia stagnalis]KWK66605.1 hypothetical protein WT81_04845 [Burkholderia stagnalis]